MNPQNSSQALQNLQGFQSGMKSGDTILKEQQGQLGVPGAQQQVSGLRQAITNTTNLLNQVAPSVYGRTQNSLVTNAQANRQIGNEQAPISQNLNSQEQQYTGANSDLDRALQQAAQQSSLAVTGQQQQLDNLKSIYSAMYQQEQDAAAKELENRKFAEAQRQFNASLKASGTGGIDLSGGNGGGGGSGSLNPDQQGAYNDAYTRLNKQSNDELLSDFLATQKSANYGNASDKYKLEVYKSLRPSLFTDANLKKYQQDRARSAAGSVQTSQPKSSSQSFYQPKAAFPRMAR